MVTEWIDTFEANLTNNERRLCDWIARQARLGVRRARYEEIQAALGILDPTELTLLLRGLRERVDNIHDMIESPIVNTAAPYFDIHLSAACIWESYLDAEAEQQPQEEPDVPYCEFETHAPAEALVGC
jgi:hypothetical protein